jgi:hypothetical protein
MSSYNSEPALGAVLRLLPCLAGMCTRLGDPCAERRREKEGELELRVGVGWGEEKGGVEEVEGNVWLVI